MLWWGNKKKKKLEPEPRVEAVQTKELVLPTPKQELKDTGDKLYDFLKQARPMCDVCKKPVEGMTMINQLATGAAKFIVDCHGDTEEMSLTREEMLSVGGIQGAKAFIGKSKDNINLDALQLDDLMPQHRQQLEASAPPRQLQLSGIIEGKIQYEEVRCQILEMEYQQGTDYKFPPEGNRNFIKWLKDPFVICYVVFYLRATGKDVVQIRMMKKDECVWNSMMQRPDAFDSTDPRGSILRWIERGNLGKTHQEFYEEIQEPEAFERQRLRRLT